MNKFYVSSAQNISLILEFVRQLYVCIESEWKENGIESTDWIEICESVIEIFETAAQMRDAIVWPLEYVILI